MSIIIERRFIVTSPVGLHLRPAVMLSQTADHFDSTICVCRQETKADAKSALSMILLDAGFGEAVTVTAQGHDAVPAMAAIEQLFQAGFSEQPLARTI
ncbi:MAG: HPr family phosphocarrier protein [Desulfosarcinaceae bacterium]